MASHERQLSAELFLLAVLQVKWISAEGMAVQASEASSKFSLQTSHFAASTLHVLQLVAVHATSQAIEAAAVEVLPSPPHLTGVAGAAAESFHPFLTVVHLAASGQVSHP